MEGLVYIGFLEIASGNSVWSGMDYYKGKKVVSWERTGPETYSGRVSGNGTGPYIVHIDKQHPRKTICSCPFADGRRIICKHMVALFSTTEPKHAEDFLKEVEEYEAEEEAREQQHYKDLKKYVMSLQEMLIDALIQLEERRNC